MKTTSILPPPAIATTDIAIVIICFYAPLALLFSTPRNNKERNYSLCETSASMSRPFRLAEFRHDVYEPLFSMPAILGENESSLVFRLCLNRRAQKTQFREENNKT